MDPHPQDPTQPSPARPPSDGKPRVAAAKVGDAVPATGAAAAGSNATRGRHFPRPPGLALRLLMMCLRPETWAEMARYPSRYTIVPLVVAILVAGVAAGIGESTRALGNLELFAATYDARYPALEISGDGVLSAKGPLAAPIRFDNGANGGTILVDPTGNTVPGMVKTPGTFLVTGRELYFFALPDAPPLRAKLSDLRGRLPGPGEVTRIDGEALRKHFADNRGGYIAQMTVAWTAVTFLSNALWAALMIFLLSPLVMVAAAGPRMPSIGAGGGGASTGPDRRLLLPRRATVRIAAAVLVPLVIFGGAMQALGHPVASLLGHEGATLFWFFSAGALCLWAGAMAKGIYLPKRAA
jgi:hypothetical protein